MSDKVKVIAAGGMMRVKRIIAVSVAALLLASCIPPFSIGGVQFERVGDTEPAQYREVVTQLMVPQATLPNDSVDDFIQNTAGFWTEVCVDENEGAALCEWFFNDTSEEGFRDLEISFTVGDYMTASEEYQQRMAESMSSLARPENSP